jgi:hypothetical protein
MPTDQPCPLTQPLRACADGLLPTEAGVELLIDHGRFLHRADFRQRFVNVFTDNSLEFAEINWAKAITALDHHDFACSGSEARILRLAASIADGIPVDLRETLTGLDTTNINHLTTAILHANGRRPSPASNPQCREVKGPGAKSSSAIAGRVADPAAYLGADPRCDRGVSGVQRRRDGGRIMIIYWWRQENTPDTRPDALDMTCPALTSRHWSNPRHS